MNLFQYIFYQNTLGFMVRVSNVLDQDKTDPVFLGSDL